MTLKFLNIYKKCTAEPYSFLVNDTTLPSDDSLRFRKNLIKFTYSPLGKAFEKQIKTIEDQGKKQVKAIQDKQIVNINKNDYKNKLLLSKEREIFKDIYNKRLDKIEELNNKINYDNLEYFVYRSKTIYDFSKLTDPLNLLDEIKKGEMSLEEPKNNQKNYLEYLNTI